MHKFAGSLLAVLASAGATVTPAAAETGADFFKGKSVSYVVATAAGGGYDFYGRLTTEYMQKHLPGATFVVRNMPGAGHRVGANYIYNSKPDGLTVGTFHTGLIYAQLGGQQGVKFDLGKMSWVGKAGSEARVVVVSTSSPVKSFADLSAAKADLKFAASAVGSHNYAELAMIAKAASAPLKLITGYNGNADQLAMRRGEVVGALGSRSSYEQFVRDGYGRYVVQIGGKQTDVPQLGHLVQSPLARQISALMASQANIFRLTAGPPDIPADRLEALRVVYKAAMTDKELIAKLATDDRPYDPAYGADVERMVKSALDQSPETVAMLAEVLKDAK